MAAATKVLGRGTPSSFAKRPTPPQMARPSQTSSNDFLRKFGGSPPPYIGGYSGSQASRTSFPFVTIIIIVIILIIGVCSSSCSSPSLSPSIASSASFNSTNVTQSSKT